MAEDILDRAANSAFAQFEAAGHEFDRLSPETQAFIRVYSAQGIIDNGGLQFFFESDWDHKPPYSVISNAYRRIGAIDCADWLDEAVALFAFENPHLDAQKRQQRMKSLWADDVGEIADLDFKLCGNESVWKMLKQFAAKHHEHFSHTG